MSAYVSAEEARLRSELLAEEHPEDEGNEALDRLLVTASALVGSLTCRSLLPSQPGEKVPTHLVDLAKQAVVMKAEALEVTAGSAAARRSAIRSGGRLQSISAGPWSESYFGPQEAMKAKMLDPDQATHQILWALATPECREKWLALWEGRDAPGAALQTFEYSLRPGGYGWPGEYL